MSVTLSFGAVRAIPDEVDTAWGARWIYPNDMVHDRQDIAGPAKDRLIAWLNGGAIRAALAEAAALAKSWRMFPQQNYEHVLYEDETGRIVGNAQGSHGYLYVAGWLK